MHFRVGEFEGPLDLLLHLVRTEEFDIDALRLLDIVEQFVAVVSGSELSEVSDFVLMASNLIAIKARYLNKGRLDFDADSEADPLEELVEKLRVYKRVKELGEYLKRREITAHSFMRDTEVRPDESVGGFSLSIQLLYAAFERVVDNLSRFDEERQAFFRLKRRNFVSVAEKRKYILELLKNSAKISFGSICRERGEVIACFLALLELLRTGRITVSQDEAFKEIYIERGLEYAPRRSEAQ